MSRSNKSQSVVELKVDLSKRKETTLKEIFPDRPMGYSELLTRFWAFIEENRLSNRSFPGKRR